MLLRGAGRLGVAATARAWLLAMSRACARLLRVGDVCFCVSLSRSRLALNFCVRVRAQGWVSGVGDVFYRPSSAIGMRVGRLVALLGSKCDNLGEFVCSLHDDVSEHGERSLAANRSAKQAVEQRRGPSKTRASLVQ